MASAVNARRYVIGCVCLLIIAAALRFYNLTEYGHLSDESVAALNSRGGFSEVVDNTRAKNSSPILYPLALWAVQQAQSTDFSIRLVPAAASGLTVGALLLLMPRAGVPRRAAFLAALLAALSAAAIEHAQDAREYSVDALCAALMIAGLLQYLRDGRRGLLCGALAVGPLLQYGLALFGVAVIGVAIVAATPPPPFICSYRAIGVSQADMGVVQAAHWVALADRRIRGGVRLKLGGYAALSVGRRRFRQAHLLERLLLSKRL